MISKIALLLALIASVHTCAQSTINNESNTMNQNQTNIAVFIADFANYSMDIQAAGMATIPAATTSEEGELYIEYAYRSGQENRNGKMTLSDKGNNRFEGNWKTDADNGNSYQGSLYFVFDKLGNADGYYKFGGSDYKITIRLLTL